MAAIGRSFIQGTVLDMLRKFGPTRKGELVENTVDKVMEKPELKALSEPTKKFLRDVMVEMASYGFCLEDIKQTEKQDGLIINTALAKDANEGLVACQENAKGKRTYWKLV